MDVSKETLNYLQLLSQQYPSIQAASIAIIELTAQLNLPKGTEHFLSDVHGEHEAFIHVIKNGSGFIRRRIDELFAQALSESERRNLATLIYYPERKMPLVLQSAADPAAWFRTVLQQLILVCRSVASKYSRARVRSYLPDSLSDVIEELLYREEENADKEAYYHSLVETVIATGSGPAVVAALAELIRRVAIARLHIVGDIYDRGPGAERVVDTLMEHPSVDIQWGNHDILWMGAAAGSRACIANAVRVSLRYANMETLEQGYAISLLPLASFAIDTYGDDPCQQFIPRPVDDDQFTEQELRLMAQMHKAITIIQLKLEGQVIKRRPHYRMENRLLLDKIDVERSVVHLDGADYPLLDTRFPSVDPHRPYELTAREANVVERLRLSFANSSRLQQHARFLFSKGSIYLVHNGNLLFHGCISMNPDGAYRAFEVDGRAFSAREFMDRLDRLARQGYFATDNPEQKQYGMDAMWYLWSGSHSPLFGKDKMATFERYFIADATTHKEKRDPYYDFREQVGVARRILADFGLDPDTGHIINGHMPVRVMEGESPIKAGGRLIVIDGGFSRAYQDRTGIAGYTLVYNSWGLLLATHHPFGSTQQAIEHELDIDSEMEILENNDARIPIKSTDVGQDIQRRIKELTALLEAYRAGLIKEG